MTSIRIGCANVKHTNTAKQIHDTIVMVAALVQYLILNEANAAAHKTIRAMSGWASWIPAGDASQNPHLWRTSVLTRLGAPSAKQLQRGGRVGLTYARVSAALKRKYRGQRLGPARWATAQRVAVNASPEHVLMIFGIHMMARVFTQHGWRKPVYMAARLVFIVWSSQLHRKFPDVPQIVMGDFNSDQSQLGNTWRRIPLPADFNHLHYTHCYVRDPQRRLASVKFVRELNTPSDHDAEVIEVTWKDAA